MGDLLIKLSSTTDVQMLYSIKYCVQSGICYNLANFGVSARSGRSPGNEVLGSRVNDTDCGLFAK